MCFLWSCSLVGNHASCSRDEGSLRVRHRLSGAAADVSLCSLQFEFIFISVALFAVSIVSKQLNKDDEKRVKAVIIHNVARSSYLGMQESSV